MTFIANGTGGREDRPALVARQCGHRRRRADQRDGRVDRHRHGRAECAKNASVLSAVGAGEDDRVDDDQVIQSTVSSSGANITVTANGGSAGHRPGHAADRRWPGAQYGASATVWILNSVLRASGNVVGQALGRHADDRSRRRITADGVAVQPACDAADLLIHGDRCRTVAPPPARRDRPLTSTGAAERCSDAGPVPVAAPPRVATSRSIPALATTIRASTLTASGKSC